MNDGKEKLSDVISGKKWKVRLNKNEVKSVALKLMLGILFDNVYDSSFLREFPTLFSYVHSVYSKNSQEYLAATSPNDFERYYWSKAWKAIGRLFDKDREVFYRPYKGFVTKEDIISRRIIKDDGDTKDAQKNVDVGFINRVEQAVDDIGKGPIVKDKKTLAKEKRTAKKKLADEIPTEEAPKKEPSVEEQIKNTVTKIAKNKELMNLSKEQLKDYLRDAYEITDENALNNMMNAVVAKRAELLANKQLKHEELTEIDISKLQEQSQRDFEKKLQDQNLRYILPAQIEKRERLVQNRLNPELLKSGY